MARSKMVEGLQSRSNGQDGPARHVPSRGPFGDPEQLRDVSPFRAAMLIPMKKIQADPDQPRKEFDEEAMRRLITSIEDRGILQPIRVRWDSGSKVYVIIAGERRWRAAAMAGLDKIPAVVHDEAVTADDLAVLQLVENCVREDLYPLDEARAFDVLQARTGWTIREMARRLGVDHQRIGKRLALLTLPTPVQGLVQSGLLDPSSAREIARLDDPAEQLELAASASGGGLTRDEVAEEVRRARAPRSAHGVYPRDTAGPSDAQGSMRRMGEESRSSEDENGGGVLAGAPGPRPDSGTPTPRPAPAPEPPVTVLTARPGAVPSGYQYRPRAGVVVSIAFDPLTLLVDRYDPIQVLEESLALAQSEDLADSAPVVVRPPPGTRVRVESLHRDGKPRHGHGREGVVEDYADGNPALVWVALDNPGGIGGVEHLSFRPEDLVAVAEEERP